MNEWKVMISDPASFKEYFFSTLVPRAGIGGLLATLCLFSTSPSEANFGQTRFSRSQGACSPEEQWSFTRRIPKEVRDQFRAYLSGNWSPAKALTYSLT